MGGQLLKHRDITSNKLKNPHTIIMHIKVRTATSANTLLPLLLLGKPPTNIKLI
uniref:Uncharacterized protein n=1 Tax=Anguilla anguilla TaxID=7936 RepID=A0A0E9X2E6_ANGAN